MRYLSLCSGIEAATVAWHPLGWEPAAFAEIESFPAAVLKHHYPTTPNLGDMTKWREWNVGAIDLLVGGTPCQSFSVAGLRKGLSDPRGGLMLTFLEIAQSLRPRWVVWENVPGVLSSGGGRDFGSFLGALGELGYGWAYRVLDAQWCRVDGYERAVPQRRRRVFVVGCLGDATRAAQVLFERQSVERNPAARGKARQGAAADAEGGVESGGWMPNNPGVVSSVCTKWSKGNGGPSGSEHFNLTVESARAWPAEVCSTLNASFGEKQGLEDQHALGGAQCFVPAATCFAGSSFARYDESQSASTIRRDGGDLGGGSETFVAVPIHDKATRHEGATGRGSGNGLGIGADGDPSPTLTSGDKHAVAMAVPFRKSHRASSATDDESWVRAETANTLNSFDTGERDTHAVTAIAFTPGNLSRGAGPSPNSEVAPTQRCSMGRGADDQRTCVAIDLYNQAIDGDCAATLTEACGGTNTSGPKVMQPAAIAFNWQNGGRYGNANEGLGITIDGTGPLQRCQTPAVAFKPSHFTRGKDGSPADITPPLSADADKGDQDTVVAYPIDGRNAMRDPEKHDEINRQGVGVGNAGDPSHTVTRAAVHAVAVAPSLTASNDPSRSPQSAEVTQQISAVHQATMVVRRLTPVECERLQGFPDGYTDIPWRGKPESPDGPRYKALGNSMAVNCMRWIGRRIDAVEKGTELPA